jgi:hypothetical protein
LETDAAFGKPYKKREVDREPPPMPGEWRSYHLKDGSDLQIRFHNEKAVNFTLFFKTPSPSPEVALARVGVDTSGWEDRTVVESIRIWEGSVGQATYQAMAFSDRGSWNGVGVEIRE